MIASAPESKTIDVYNAVTKLVDSTVPEYLMAKVTENDARNSYDALMEFVDVVKANPITPIVPATTVSESAAASISAAAGELAKATYPFIKSVDWTDPLYAKTVPGKSPLDTLKAIDAMIVMGAKMDAAALKEAARAHVKAIENMDAKGVLTESDYAAVLTGLGKAISSVPTYQVMGVYNEMSALVGGSGIPEYIYKNKVNPVEAVAAYNALIKFKDVVSFAQNKQNTLFNPANEIGVTAPLGVPGFEIWDPAGFCNDISEKQFRQYRSAELKHGRVAMLATFGLIVQANGVKFPGLEGTPDGIMAAVTYPSDSFLAVLLLCVGFFELNFLNDEGREPGNFGDPFKLATSGNGTYTTQWRNFEIQNGRLAMFGVIGTIAAEYVSGLDAVDQWAVTLRG